MPGLGVHPNLPIVGIVPTTDYKGYFLVGADGGVFSFGDAPFENSLPGLGVHVSNIVGIVATNNDQGYFLVGSDGGVFSFGNAPFENSLPGLGVHVTNIIGIAPTANDGGYWVVSSTGSVYAVRQRHVLRRSECEHVTHRRDRRHTDRSRLLAGEQERRRLPLRRRQELR